MVGGPKSQGGRYYTAPGPARSRTTQYTQMYLNRKMRKARTEMFRFHRQLQGLNL